MDRFTIQWFMSQLLWLLAVSAISQSAWATDPEILRPRVPSEQIVSARSMTNPLAATPEQVRNGKAIFHGKGFCVACHGRDGKGLGEGLELKGALPRDFTDAEWQAARADGELFWVLENGSKGTAMAPFIPLVLTEEEGWQVLLYVRSFAAGR
jgi:mono/diheme cytochrome c family protein